MPYPINTNGHAAHEEAPEPRKKPLIPPHIAWPGFVIGLLLLSAWSAFGALFAANSDGGAQIVEGYYDAAVRFDEEQAARTASAALGWTTALEVGACEGGLCAVELTVRDRAAAPVSGLKGVLQMSRPQEAGTVATIPLSPRGDAPGVYRQLVPLHADGLWDFTVTARRGDERFLTTLRRDVSR